MSLTTIPDALAALQAGKPVIVADSADRENEGDVIFAAQFATPQLMAWAIRVTSGFICAPMTNTIADRLELPVMVIDNRDPLATNYTVSVDAADRRSTGISATERAHTVNVLADAAATAGSLNRPGHIMPLRAVDGGVRERGGHTEAAVDLLRLAGLTPVGVIGEIVREEDGEMMRLPELLEFGEREGVPVTTIEALVAYLAEHEVPLPAPSPRLSFEVETTTPTTHGPLRMRAYHDHQTGADHLAIVAGDPATPGALVRVHSECLTGEVFGSLKCECGPQLNAALDEVQQVGGVVIYLRGHEGRGIGLINKLRAYRLQEDGLDTVDANTALGLPVDAREYGAAAEILRDIGIDEIRLLTNNPEKTAQLRANGIAVTEQVPLVVGVQALNEGYLAVKRDRLGHTITIGHE
ncbi:3,4-dihydroxy-2-butanone-4-phosphate synthase [Gryllotalpicola sp.]|uniref:3,4-dihydroxy-2-butanone-4-phosphate synthase n=1 Tax=Gryllotalpicola sp. TaxID=1932787 RepID=UPI0026188A2B|nr:3,4-dihydroxy-2-butanone-4-phosphate synthase [Gryllotalpicola sp.]